ncbi:MAG: hypothetical protein IPP29_19190 [Bacteroidetes bacterium]|nr:hypothetical protein [Bacteroidota bacterium]
MASRLRNKFFRTERESNEIGFGTKVIDTQRMLNRDGSFNVKRTGLPFLAGFSFYHWFITLRWSVFFLVIAIAYFIINLIFATLYFVFGTNHFAGVEGITFIDHFTEMFFFSTQTFTTVGYGRVNPMGFGVNLIAAIESLTGLLFFALATGLLYGRFARPVAKFSFSNNIIVAPFKDITGLMFRVANKFNHQLIDLEATVTFSIVQELNGVKQRRFHFLKLELAKINFFPTSWTINHPIDDSSPLYALTLEDLAEGDTEFLILLKAFDENFAQNVNIRYSYKHTEVIYGAKFVTMMDGVENGMQVMNMQKIDVYEKVELPTMADLFVE